MTWVSLLCFEITAPRINYASTCCNTLMLCLEHGRPRERKYDKNAGFGKMFSVFGGTDMQMNQTYLRHLPHQERYVCRL